MEKLLFVLLNSNRISNEDLLKWGVPALVIIIMFIALYYVIHSLFTLHTFFFTKKKDDSKEIKK